MTASTDDILAALRQAVYDDSALQARLSALENPGDFFAAVRQLAESLGHSLDEDEVLQAVRAGRRAWFERALP